MLVGNANSSLTLKESPEAESGLRRQHLSELAGVWNVKTQTWKQLLWNDKHVLYFFSSRNLNFYFGLRYEKKFGKKRMNCRMAGKAEVLWCYWLWEFKISEKPPETVEFTF